MLVAFFFFLQVSHGVSPGLRKFEGAQQITCLFSAEAPHERRDWQDRQMETEASPLLLIRLILETN